ncbi:MAG: dTDP-4-dehydrorhamnose reductase [Methyloligella sp. ZOD6]
MLVVGRTGQLAKALAEWAEPCGIEAEFLGRDRLDLADTGSIRKKLVTELRSGSWNVILNAAAFTAVDRAEEEEDLAFAVNATAPGEIAAAATQADVPVIHISTDYVFDGEKSGPYVEDDEANPLGVYGRSKLQGEHAVRDACDRHVIIRTAWVYSAVGKNFMLTMLKLGREREILRVVDDQIGTPTATNRLARALHAIAIQLVNSGSGYGTYHLAGEGETTWCGFARRILELGAERCGEGTRWAHIEPISTAEYPTPVQRPANSRLSSAHAAEIFNVTLGDWRSGLEETFDQWLKGG